MLCPPCGMSLHIPIVLPWCSRDVWMASRQRHDDMSFQKNVNDMSLTQNKWHGSLTLQNKGKTVQHGIVTDNVNEVVSESANDKSLGESKWQEYLRLRVQMTLFSMQMSWVYECFPQEISHWHMTRVSGSANDLESLTLHMTWVSDSTNDMSLIFGVQLTWASDSAN